MKAARTQARNSIRSKYPRKTSGSFSVSLPREFWSSPLGMKIPPSLRTSFVMFLIEDKTMTGSVLNSSCVRICFRTSTPQMSGI